MSNVNGEFIKKGSDSVPYEENADLKRKLLKQRKFISMLCVRNIKLQQKLCSKNQEIDALYDKLYWMTELPKKAADRKRLRTFVKDIESRPMNSWSDSFMDLSDMSLMWDDEGIGLKRGGRKGLSKRDRYDNSWGFIEDILYDDESEEYGYF